MRKKYESLPVEKQIVKIQQENVALIVISIIISLVLLSLCIFLFTQTDQIKLAIGMLIAWPFSIFFGGVLQIRENKIRIKNFENQINSAIQINHKK